MAREMTFVEMAEALRKQGKHGDSVVMHVSPAERDFLQERSGNKKLNSKTKMPQAYDVEGGSDISVDRGGVDIGTGSSSDNVGSIGSEPGVAGERDTNVDPNAVDPNAQEAETVGVGGLTPGQIAEIATTTREAAGGWLGGLLGFEQQFSFDPVTGMAVKDVGLSLSPVGMVASAAFGPVAGMVAGQVGRAAGVPNISTLDFINSNPSSGSRGGGSANTGSRGGGGRDGDAPMAASDIGEGGGASAGGGEDAGNGGTAPVDEDADGDTSPTTTPPEQSRPRPGDGTITNIFNQQLRTLYDPSRWTFPTLTMERLNPMPQIQPPRRREGISPSPRIVEDVTTSSSSSRRRG